MNALPDETWQRRRSGVSFFKIEIPIRPFILRPFMSEGFRLLHLSDIHLQNEMFEEIRTHLRTVVDRCNDTFHPDAVAVTGDLVQDEDPAVDRRHIEQVTSLLDGVDAPVYYTAGNHDLANLEEDDVASLVGMPLTTVHEVDEYSLVLLNSAKSHLSASGMLAPEQVEFLKSSLAEHERCLLFVHHPPHYLSLRNNPWFSESPERALLRNKREVNNVIERFRSALAVFNGHVHENAATVSRNAPRFTLNAFNKATRTSTEPTGSFAEVTVTDDRITREVYDRRGFVRSDGRPLPV